MATYYLFRILSQDQDNDVFSFAILRCCLDLNYTHTVVAVHVGEGHTAAIKDMIRSLWLHGEAVFVQIGNLAVENALEVFPTLLDNRYKCLLVMHYRRCKICVNF